MTGTTDSQPAAEVLHATSVDGRPVTITRADERDEADLKRFFASVTMDADLQLAVHREPSLLAMYAIQPGSHETWIGRVDGELVGMGTLLARDGYVDGQLRRVGYLGDLRLDPCIRGRSVLSTMYGTILDDFARRHGVDAFLTAVIASNDRAVRALTGPGARAAGIPTYHLLRRFDIRATHLLLPRRLPRVDGLQARRATDDDVPAIAALLDEVARTQPFGIPMDEAELRRRITTWQGLAIDDFHLVEDHRDGRSGELAGCLATWDVSGYKQTVAVDYRGSMRRVRRSYDIAATLLRARRLPPPGGTLEYSYATHHAVRGDDVDVQRLLLASAYCHLRAAGGPVLFSSFVPKGDPLRPAWRGYVNSDLAAHLYVVVPHGGELPADLAHVEGRPGFEMALV